MNLETPKGGKLRLEILEKSISLEKKLANMLNALLKVENRKAKTLGYGTSTLSFADKVNLLYDLGFLDLEAYSKFMIFLPIRNYFVHWEEATSFCNVMQELDSGIRNKFALLNLQDELNHRKEIAQGHNLKEPEISLESIKLYADIRAKIDKDEIEDLTDDQIELFSYLQWVLFESNLTNITIKLYEKMIERMKSDAMIKSLTLDNVYGLFKSAIHIAILEGNNTFNISSRKDMLLILNYNKVLAERVDLAFEKVRLDIQRTFDDQLNKVLL
ncbi:MAG: hypothetical protein HYZ14_15400 [Bacteroidetes bacterium]|nr:hypothetical protein [Bacteroidota bacterium]